MHIPSMKQDETELIAQILGGDQNAYGVLVDRYKTGLYRHCFKFAHNEDEAEDLAQSAFIKAYVHLESYDPRYRFSTWLYKIATNLALMQLRKRRGYQVSDDELDRIVSDLAEPDQLALDKELHDLVETLPIKHRTVVTMYYWQGMGYQDIAIAMGTSVGSVKGWMSRAKKQLKEVLS